MDAILIGLAASLTPANLGFALVGAMIGTLVGVLPGVGPVATIALLLPVSFHLSPEGALILLAGVYYGAQYGSSTSAILVNLPGEASGAVTAIDGHRLARSGRGAEALAVAALASLVAGIGSALVLAVATPPLAAFALRIGPLETASLLALGAGVAVLISDGGPMRAMLMLTGGALIGLIGVAGGDGQPRFTFGVAELRDGVAFTPLVIGLFGFSEVLLLMARRLDETAPTPAAWWPGWRSLRGWWSPALRGATIGSVIGVLPGATTLLASFAAYALEKRLRKVAKDEPSLAGVAAPEAANNASAQSSFAILFGLGLPANAATAVLVGAMLLHGLPPGPAIFSVQPNLFWTFIGSLVIANVMLVVINLPLVGIWVKLVQTPPAFLAPAILAVSALGVLAAGGAAFDVASIGMFGLFGYAARRTGYPLMPVLMGYVIAAPFEDHLRRAITHARGDWGSLLFSPSVLGVAALLIIIIAVRKKKPGRV
jgi:putative tricarboxylic transport membrane protein